MRKAFFIWEIPQLLAAFVLYLVLRKNIAGALNYKECRVYLVKNFKGGISLSWLIFLDSRQDDMKNIAHEYGHSLQSLYLGWLYLAVVGLPSIIRSIVWKKYDLDPKKYFRAFPEAWAERLGKSDLEKKEC
ncbi:MAG: hypothetical protein ACQEP5_10285 [Actinomycetota bacterium]